MRFIFALSIGVLISACASVPEQMSRSESLEKTSKTYQAIKPDELFESIGQIFRLSDQPSDIVISYPDAERLLAVRWAAPFPIHTWYHWNIKVVASGAGSKVDVSIATTSHGFAVPAGMTPLNSPEVIKLFYARLDFLVGESRSDWPTCDDFRKLVRKRSSLDALCLLAEDRLPSSNPNKNTGSSFES